MAITRFGVGAVASAGSGNITPALPASTAANDIAIIICAQADNVVSTLPAGWTIVDATNNNGLNNERLWWAWKRLGSGESNPTITHSAGDSIIARISVYRGVRTSGNPYDSKTVTASTGASTTVTGTAVTPTGANAMIVFCGGQADNSSYSGYSGTNPTFGEAIDNLTTTGTDASIFLADGIRTTADSTGNRTATASRSFENVGFLIALEEPSAGQTIAAGQSTETDTGQAVTVNPYRRLAGQVTETDTSQAVGRVKTRAAAQTVETDASQTVTARKTRSVASATETDTAQAASVNPIRRLAGQASETDTGQAVTTKKTRAAAQATETDTAQAASVNPIRRLAAQAVETDTGQAVTRAKTRAVAQAAETDTAQAVTRAGQTIQVAQAVEADTATTPTARKTRAVGQPAETDTAQAVTYTSTKVVTVAQAVEADTAQAVAVNPIRRLVGQAVETDTAQTVTRLGGDKPASKPPLTFPIEWVPTPSAASDEEEALALILLTLT